MCVYYDTVRFQAENYFYPDMLNLPSCCCSSSAIIQFLLTQTDWEVPRSEGNIIKYFHQQSGWCSAARA